MIVINSSLSATNSVVLKPKKQTFAFSPLWGGAKGIEMDQNSCKSIIWFLDPPGTQKPLARSFGPYLPLLPASAGWAAIFNIFPTPYLERVQTKTPANLGTMKGHLNERPCQILWGCQKKKKKF